MIPKEILREIRRISDNDLTHVTDVFAGQYQSVSKAGAWSSMKCGSTRPATIRLSTGTSRRAAAILRQEVRGGEGADGDAASGHVRLLLFRHGAAVKDAARGQTFFRLAFRPSRTTTGSVYRLYGQIESSSSPQGPPMSCASSEKPSTCSLRHGHGYHRGLEYLNRVNDPQDRRFYHLGFFRAGL